MKTRLTFLQTIAFALALAWWMPLSAQTQGGGESKPPPQTNRDDEEFNFPGGTPRDFLAAVEKHYKADWLSIASIPHEMEYVRVPKLRIPPGPVSILPHMPVAGDEAQRSMMQREQREHPLASKLWGIVLLYNRLSEHEPQLGSLVVEAPSYQPEKPYVVMLAPNKSAGGALIQMKTKAFPLKGILETAWATLADEIAQTGEETRMREEKMTGREASFPGNVSVHRGSALLVVMGSESFVEMAESMVAAFQANQKP